jgi:tetratricopeptide (TPR) repeat protein
MVETELYKRGYEQLKAGNYEEAKRLFRANEEAAGTAAETKALLRQAETRLAQGDVNSAARIYEQLVDRNPSLPEVYLGLTRISLFTQQHDGARVHATAAVRLGPELGSSWMLLGLVHETEGDVEAAVRHLRKAVELSPGVFLCQFNLGRVLAVAGRAAEGIAPLLEATRLEPGNPDGFYTLGMLYKQAGQGENALRAFEKARELAPKNLDYWATLADVLIELKRFREARELLGRAIAACGDHPALQERVRKVEAA